MIIDRKSTYLAFISNSVGSRIFKNIYFRAGKYRKDITKNGEFSCAIYVSSILYLLDLIDKPHVTVRTTVTKLLKNKWIEVQSAQKGDILVWEKRSNHQHIGFCFNRQIAISNSSSKRGKVIKHHITYNNKRKIAKILRYKNF